MVETSTLSEIEPAEYCRKKGLYVEQVKKGLQRKESALAKTAALLVLRKNINAIWRPKDEEV